MEDFFNKSNSTLLNESINIITNKTNNVSENIINLLLKFIYFTHFIKK